MAGWWRGSRGGARGSAVVAVLLVAGCGGVATTPPPPSLPPPEAGAYAPLVLREPDPVFLSEPPPEIHDEILRSPMANHPEFRSEVDRWVRYFSNAGWFSDYLERMSWFAGAVDSTLADKGLPPSLRYLPIIESGYSPGAVSRASAVGLWQFMAPTARGFGMWVGPLLDERRDPYKSTDAATDFLLELRERFGSWFLALAAYNSGPYRVQRLLEGRAPLVPPSDSLLWALRHHLPRETREYIPKFFAAALVATNPPAHGITPPPSAGPLVFEEVSVPDATTLDVVAEAAGVAQEDIERLNPEIVRGITPPGRETVLRVPVGTGGTFRDRYALIPPEERVTFLEHVVGRGETLSHIARRYGVPLSELQAANPAVDARRLRIGQRLTVPVASRRARTTTRSGLLPF